MVTALLVSSLVGCFFLALLDYTPNKYSVYRRVLSRPLFRLVFSLIVVLLSLLLLGITSPTTLLLLAPASSFLAHAILAFLQK